MDDECTDKILRAKTLVLGELEESPEKSPPVDVQPGKALPAEPSCLKTGNPPDGEAFEPTCSIMGSSAPAVEPAPPPSFNNAEPSDQPAAPATQPGLADASLPASSVEEPLADMSGHQAKGAAGDDGPDKIKNIANPASGQKDPFPTEDTLVGPAGAAKSATEDTLGEPTGASEPSEVDFEKIPSVTREAQQAFKNTIKPPKARGKTRKPADEGESELGKLPRKPAASAARMKRPAAAKPPRQSKKARAEPEENPDMGDTKKDLDAEFAAVAEGELGESTNKEPEKNKQKPGRKRKASTDAGEPGCRALPLTGLTSKNGEQRATFAGRPAPKSVQANNRFTVMLTTYTSRIAPFIKKKGSEVEAWCS